MNGNPQSDFVVGARNEGLARFRVSTLLCWGTAAAFGLVAGLTIFLVRQQIRAQALIEAESKARLLLNRNLATHHYLSLIHI